jgi:ABC-type Zn uptake system ZnuABC Zn-binding protein ZnuA
MDALPRRTVRLSRNVRGADQLATALAIMLGALACGGAAVSTKPIGDRVGVVATTTVLADMVANVGGDLVDVRSLVPRGGDVHTYAPKPDDLRAITAARLLVMNGLGLDDWLDRLISDASASGTPVVKLAEGLSGVELLPGEEAGTENPHLFMDVRYAERYADRLAEALIAADPERGDQFRAQGDAYVVRLEALDAEVRAAVATIPIENRKLVTFHDAFPYYAREYGIEVVGVAVKAPGQEPSAAAIAELIKAIRGSGVKAIFSEDQFPTRLVDQIAAETGARVVANLYDDALGDPPITSYEAVIRWDTEQLVQALR